MSYSRRGGRWGMNFLSANGSNTSLSMNSLQATEAAMKALQERSESAAGDGHGTRMVVTQGGRAAYAPPSPLSVSLPPGAQTRFAPGRSLPHESVGVGSGTTSGGASRAFSNLGKRRMHDDDDYFNDDEEGEELEYQPAPGSPAGQTMDEASNDVVESDDSDDPLEKYMASIEHEVQKINSADKGTNKKQKPKENKGVRDDIEQEDEMEAYLRFMEENPNVGLTGDEEEVYEYDAEGNIIATEKKAIDPLPPVDHSNITYAPFTKNFYIEHPDITQLTESGVADLLSKLNIRVSGLSPPRPACSFAHLNLDEALMESIRSAGYTKPMPIQAAAVPAALAGRDIVGIAKTGSGKTLAFLWPMITHIMAQPALKVGDGPIGIICAPTRELALQIYSEAKKVAKIYNLTVICAYGGGSLWEQQKACEAGCELLVCTPGRLIDLVRKKSTNLHRTTFLVFDEADKMFNLGFEPQVRSIANHVRPDRQALLFSATFKRKIEQLARDILTDPVRIVQGEVGEANEDITQIVHVFDKWDDKWLWLTANLVKFTSEGSVLVFVTRKAHAEEVAQKLRTRDFKVLLIHGDMHQSERNTVIHSFKHQEAPILVATDVASRGLDIPSVHNVVNYEVARDIDTHTHRVGRTGRAGVKGTAYTLFVVGRDPPDFAAHLVRHLELANQVVPQRLLDVALKCVWFANNRSGGGSSAANPRAGIGFLPREKRDQRAGLGSLETSSSSPSTPAVSAPTASATIPTPSAGPATVAASPAHQTDRLSAMKAAFAAQYQRRFVSAGIEATRYTHPELLGQQSTVPSEGDQTFRAPQVPASTKPPDGKRKRSRWD
uniref:RNA helicase n=2 Tax=Schistocephalus solidus TaxID=70667 RepID=A0A0X3P7G9_SCHSO